jgi:hypothetical protein
MLYLSRSTPPAVCKRERERGEGGQGRVVSERFVVGLLTVDGLLHGKALNGLRLKERGATLNI